MIFICSNSLGKIEAPQILDDAREPCTENQWSSQIQAAFSKKFEAMESTSSILSSRLARALGM
jgi:hypothetical protein